MTQKLRQSEKGGGQKKKDNQKMRKYPKYEEDVDIKRT